MGERKSLDGLEGAIEMVECAGMKIKEWILEERIKTAIIQLIRDGAKEDEIQQVVVTVMRRILNEVEASNND